MKSPVIADASQLTIPPEERAFIDRLRGLSIIRVVLVHLGLSWFYPPYSQFFHNLLPVLFFVSGAVSYYSCLRSNSGRRYLFRRSLSMVGPFYVIAFFSLIVYWALTTTVPGFDIGAILRWITIIPNSEDTPFPMGQIWFIHAMVIIVFLSFPIFLMSKYSVFPLVLCILASAALSVSQQVFDINDYFYIMGHNLYQGMVNLGFFAFGALYYRKMEKLQAGRIFSLLIFSLSIVLFNIFVLDVDVNMANHSYSPDSYYLAASYCAIFLVILAKRLINYLCNSLHWLDAFILFYSKHAYSVFIVHSFSVFWLEQQFQLTDVKTDPLLGVIKLVLVFLISSMLAIPSTWLSKKLTNWLQTIVLGRTTSTMPEKSKVGIL